MFKKFALILFSVLMACTSFANSKDEACEAAVSQETINKAAASIADSVKLEVLRILEPIYQKAHINITLDDIVLNSQLNQSGGTAQTFEVTSIIVNDRHTIRTFELSPNKYWITKTTFFNTLTNDFGDITEQYCQLSLGYFDNGDRSSRTVLKNAASGKTLGFFLRNTIYGGARFPLSN